jgi:hypothetical protein
MGIEKTHRNSRGSYLYLKLAKTSCFSFYLLWFFFYKIGEQEVRKCSAWVVGCWHQWEGEGGRENGKRINTVQIVYTYVCKSKNDTC